MPILMSIVSLVIVSYLIGSLSTARLIAKHFKQLKISKVGTGHPDTENIYQNVSKSLGILAGVVDSLKMYVYLFFLSYVYSKLSIDSSMIDLILIITGFAMIIGHCLPVTNKFKGGRGLFTFIGYGLYFVPWTMLIVLALAIIVIACYKQVRFAQYMIVLLPPFISYFIPGYKPMFHYLLGASVLMGIINVIVSKRLGEI